MVDRPERHPARSHRRRAGWLPWRTILAEHTPRQDRHRFAPRGLGWLRRPSGVSPLIKGDSLIVPERSDGRVDEGCSQMGGVVAREEAPPPYSAAARAGPP